MNWKMWRDTQTLSSYSEWLDQNPYDSAKLMQKTFSSHTCVTCYLKNFLWLFQVVIFIQTFYTISFNISIIYTVCHLLRSGVAAIFGPQSAPAAAHVQSICDTMELPHLETRWDYRTRRESCLVNLYPHPAALSRVCQIYLSFLIFTQHHGLYSLWNDHI